MAPTVTLQTYAIGSGLAQGATGLYLARELAKVDDVPIDYVAGAVFLSVILTFVPALLLISQLKGRP
jgi:hypothetical protein